MATNIIYTLGHSNLLFDNFYKLLKYWDINCLIDVRSTPYSNYTVHFNKENLSNELKKNSIVYLHFKDEFGARPTDKKLYNEKGQVDFKKMTNSLAFKKGVERLEKGVLKKYNIALMCSCADPLVCHRFIMIAKYLSEKTTLTVKHIFPYNKKYNHLLQSEKRFLAIEERDKRMNYYIKDHQVLEKFDQQKYQPNLFFNVNDLYFEDKNKKIGYKLKV